MGNKLSGPFPVVITRITTLVNLYDNILQPLIFPSIYYLSLDVAILVLVLHDSDPKDATLYLYAASRHILPIISWVLNFQLDYISILFLLQIDMRYYLQEPWREPILWVYSFGGWTISQYADTVIFFRYSIYFFFPLLQTTLNILYGLFWLLFQSFQCSLVKRTYRKLAHGISQDD